MNFADSFYQEFRQVPMQIYQVEQMFMLGQITADDAYELAFNLNMDMYRGCDLPEVKELQMLIEHRKRCA